MGEVSSVTADLQRKTAGFAALTARIRAWTLNLLASAIVLALGLAIGWQVMLWWKEGSPSAVAGAALARTATDQLPPLPRGYEFLTQHGKLQIERVEATAEQALAEMCRRCRTAPPATERPIAASEKAFVEQLLDQTPLEQAGDMALYQPRGQNSMVVAVDSSRQQIVSWSFALPADGGVWSLYHFSLNQPAAGGPHE